MILIMQTIKKNFINYCKKNVKFLNYLHLSMRKYFDLKIQTAPLKP